MKTTVHFNAYSGKKLSSFCVKAKGNGSKEWVYKFPPMNSNLVSLCGALFSLACPKSRADIALCTSSRYVIDMLEKDDGSWKREAKSYKDVVEALRSVYDSYDAVEVVFDKDGEEMRHVKEKARSIRS
jgi:hypothetical protein